MPSILGHADDYGLSWKAYTGTSSYPVAFYQQLNGSVSIVRSDQILIDAGHLPALSMVWHDSPYDEHPVADVTKGQDKIWQAVDAIVTAGGWDDTVFLLTGDDWGGFDDHVITSNLEHTPNGVQLAYGLRVPLLMFGGRVQTRDRQPMEFPRQRREPVLDLLRLPPLGVTRLDQAPTLADLISSPASRSGRDGCRSLSVTCCCSPAAPQTVVLARASFERTSTSGVWGSCGCGIAARANSAIAPGRKTRQ
jgi:hypothetical protein